MSAAARKRIAEAQRKRWAARKKTTAEGKRRVIDATKKRWAAWPAQKEGGEGIGA